ncbi:MAG: ABC transporter permease [Lachnospiraceae bacterium]|nr:ABC transporter permease [Lachnospiraceae bacterium]
MFLTLLKKEGIQYIKSATYYIFLACLVLFFVSQMGVFSPVQKPEPGYEDYGEVRTTDKNLIMENVLEELIEEYSRGEYTTYPVGFYKKVVLDEEEQRMVAEGISVITGMSIEEINTLIADYEEKVQAAIEEASKYEGPIMESSLPAMEVSVKFGLSFQTFSEEMQKIDKLLGGGSSYNESSLQFTGKPASYEEAMEEYESHIRDDKVTNAHARLFCDYMGILLGFLPVILAVTRGMRDKKAQAEQVIYTKKAGAFSVILSRYAAAVIMTLLPVVLLSCVTLVEAIYYAKHVGVAYDALAFVKYIGFWLLPIIMVSLSVGFFFTELTDSAVAILIQGVWWYVSVFMKAGDLVDCTGWNLIPRWNAVGQYALFEQMKEELLRSRLFYAAMALGLLFLTVFFYSKKRKGEFTSVGAKLFHRKSKLEA